MNKLIVIFLLLFEFSSCKNRSSDLVKEDFLGTTFYPLSETILTDDINNYVEDIQFIPMGNDENSFFADIMKMLVDKEGNMYILDTRGNIKLFDEDGMYISKISNKGRASNEYLSVSDIAISDKEIIILDGIHIKCYDKITAEWIRNIEIPIKSPCDAIAPASNGGMYLYSAYPASHDMIEGVNDNLLYQIDENGKVIKQLIRRDDITVSLYNISQTNMNKYYLRPQNSLHIFNLLTEGEVIPKYRFDFENKNIPHRYFYEQADGILSKYMMANYYKIPMNLQETDQCLFLRVCGPRANEINIVYDKSSSKGIRWRNYECDMMLQILSSDNEYFYAILPEQQKDANTHGPLYSYVTSKLEEQNLEWLDKTVVVKIKFKMPE